jgi:hypothetical protein
MISASLPSPISQEIIGNKINGMRGSDPSSVKHRNIFINPKGSRISKSFSIL